MTAPSPPPRRDNLSRAESWFGQFWTLLVRLALIVFLGYFLWRVRSILTDVLVAAILAFALIGPVNWLCRFRVKRLQAGLLGMFLTAPLAAMGRVLVQYSVIRPRHRAGRSRLGSPPLIITSHQTVT